MTCYDVLRPKIPPLSSENLSLYFASLINRSTSSFVDTTIFVSTFAGVIRTFVFILPLLGVDKSHFPQSQSAHLQRPKKMNSLYPFIFERIKAEISRNRILFQKQSLHYESRNVLLMTTAASHKTYLAGCNHDQPLSR